MSMMMRQSMVGTDLRELVQLAQPASRINLDALRTRSALGGAGLSRLRGRGMEYDESRPYQEGDELRNIDWRVTARTGRAHTKLFREERERPVLLWVDLRPGMFFATCGVYKAVLAQRAAAMLAWAAVQQGDRVGIQISAAGPSTELRPARGRRAVLQVLHALLSAQQAAIDAAEVTQEPVSADVTVARLARVTRPGTRVFALSDFHDLDDGVCRRLRELSQHCDLLTLLFYDRLECELPPAGRYRLLGPRGEEWLDSARPGLAELHRERFERRRRRLRRLTDVPGVHHLECRTDEPVIGLLERRFARRTGRAVRG